MPFSDSSFYPEMASEMMKITSENNLFIEGAVQNALEMSSELIICKWRLNWCLYSESMKGNSKRCTWNHPITSLSSPFQKKSIVLFYFRAATANFWYLLTWSVYLEKISIKRPVLSNSRSLERPSLTIETLEYFLHVFFTQHFFYLSRHEESTESWFHGGH